MSVKRRRFAFAAAFFALLATSASAQDSTPISVQGGWSPAAPSSTAVAYFTVQSAHDDELLGASSDCCAAVELHTHSMDDGIMRMRRIKRVALPAGQTIRFAPHGLHVMLIGLKQPVAIGGTIPLTLHFAHAPAQQIRIAVQNQAPETGDAH